MTVLADTNCILAFLDRDDRHHSAVVQIVQTENILIPATVLPEVDYLTTKYLGERVAKAFLKDLVEDYFTYLPVDINYLKQPLSKN